MFATLLGGLPRPNDAHGPKDASHGLGDVLEAQARAGLAPVTDGRLGDPTPADIASELLSGRTTPAVARW